MRRLEANVPEFSLDAWVRPLVVEPNGEGLRLLCPSPFHRERIRDRFLPGIARCVEEETGRSLPIELGVARRRPEPERTRRPEPPAQPTPCGGPPSLGSASLRGASGALPPGPEPRRRRPSQPPLPHTFDSFVVGPCNALAREACFALAHDQQRGLNPLYLSSEPGLGKTHLARAVVHEARRCGSQRTIYDSAESFTNRFTNALRSKSMDLFKHRYREQCDLLVVEDLQFLSSKTSTQLEFFHTLTHLVDAGLRVTLTGDRLPRDIERLDPRLRSQLTAGLVAEIEPPDATVRRNILRSKAAAGGVRVPDDCLDLLVEAVRGSVRDLEGALIQLVTTAALLKRSIDLELTRMALRKLAPVPPRKPHLEPETIIDVVAGFFGTNRAALASRSRRRDVLVPRQLAMYLCRRYTDHPLSRIARAFDRDHPAVSNAVKVVERKILERAPLRYQVEELSARLDRL
ncbi:MAG: chromosomal replication initiator protein DnaA [Deltaproteobacteria bacterium]|nr:chromosomal replication initiator protein DnaA [Deltaproteobacteria bacterium]